MRENHQIVTFCFVVMRAGKSEERGKLGKEKEEEEILCKLKILVERKCTEDGILSLVTRG